MSKRGFIILVTCYQVGYWTRHCYICIQQMSQEVERELHYWEYEHDFFISQSCIKLSKDSLFARSFIKVMLPGGKKKLHRLSGGHLLPACTDNWFYLSHVEVFFFFFFSHLKRPLACNICLGCYIEEGGEKKRNILPIAALIPELLRFFFLLPQRGHFHWSVWQNKRSALLLHEKQISHLLNWETNANPFSGVSFEHSS